MKTAKRLFALVMCLMFLLTPLAVMAEETPLLADADGDGVITTTDARLVLSFTACKCVPFPDQEGVWVPPHGIENQELRERFIQTCDVDGDKVLTSTDARLILQYAVSKIDVFPVQAV